MKALNLPTRIMNHESLEFKLKIGNPRVPEPLKAAHNKNTCAAPPTLQPHARVFCVKPPVRKRNERVEC